MILPPRASRAVREAWLDLFTVAAGFGPGSQVVLEQVERLREFVSSRLKAGANELLQQQLPLEIVDDLKLPMVALIDEAVARQPGLHAHWNPINLEMYKNTVVGNKVFERLRVLMNDPGTPVEVLEVYARCLMWGLEGEYRDGRQEELHRLFLTLMDLIKLRLEATPVIPPLEADHNLRRSSEVLNPWWVAALVGAWMLLAGFGYWAFFLHNAREVGHQLQDIEGALSTVVGRLGLGGG